MQNRHVQLNIGYCNEALNAAGVRALRGEGSGNKRGPTSPLERFLFPNSPKVAQEMLGLFLTCKIFFYYSFRT